MTTRHVALLIIDMQNDFLHENGFVSRYSKEIGVPEDTFFLLLKPVPIIQKLEKFFYDRQLETIYIYTAWNRDHSDVYIPLKKMKEEARLQGALVEDSWGAEMIAELTPRPESHLIMKKSYGGFFRTDLDHLLQKLSIKTLFLTGVATNYCVETTAREAVGYGYEVVMISDATATYSKEGHQASLTVIGSGFGEVMTSEEVIKTLSD